MRQPSGRETDSETLPEGRRGACVNTHPAFKKSFRQDALAKIASHHGAPYLVHVIKAIDAAQGGPPPEPSGAELAAGAMPAEPVDSDIPLLTLEEKRRILARIARVNPMDCIDDSGAFDIVRAKRILPPGAVCHIAIHETPRINAEGQPVTERHLNVRLVDPVSALRLDDLMERRRERTASASRSDSSPKNFSRRDFKLLTEKTMALDDVNQSIALLKKALAEAHDRELQLSKELEEKDRQLEVAQRDTGCQPVQEKPENAPSSGSSRALQSRDQSREAGFSTPLSEKSKAQNASNTSIPNPNQPRHLSLLKAVSLPNPDQSSQRDPSCQPVDSNYQTSQTLSSAEEPQALSPSNGQPLSNVEGDTLSEAERKAKKRRERAARLLEQEIEYRRNISGIGEFNAWLRGKGMDPANYPPLPLPTKTHAARPPP